MSMRVRISLVLLICLFLSIGCVSGVALADGTEGDQQRVVISIDDDGNAEWQIEIRTALDDSGEREDFELWMDSIEENTEEHESDQQERFDNIVAIADEELDRDMQVEDVSVGAEVTETPSGDWGVMTISFTWTSFADVTDDRIATGEVFQDGYAISESESLVIEVPDGYSIVEGGDGAESTNENQVSWDGPVTFGENEPDIVFEQKTGSNEDGSGEGDVSINWILILVLVGVIGAVAYSLVTKKNESQSDDDEEDVETESESESLDEEQPQDLQSDTERVVGLLKDNGGRMKQKEVGDALEWSDAKVSRIAGTLEEEGEIEKLRIGRENILKLRVSEE